MERIFNCTVAGVFVYHVRAVFISAFFVGSFVLWNNDLYANVKAEMLLTVPVDIDI